MKKIIVAVVVLFLAVGCSSDNGDEIETGLANLDGFEIEEIIVGECIEGHYARIRIDVSEGLNSPRIQFIGNFENATINTEATAYNGRIELQELGDCEDLENTTGNSTTFEIAETINITSKAAVVLHEISRQQIPYNCYKWRLVVYAKENENIICESPTEWYDAPLF